MEASSFGTESECGISVGMHAIEHSAAPASAGLFREVDIADASLAASEI